MSKAIKIESCQNCFYGSCRHRLSLHEVPPVSCPLPSWPHLTEADLDDLILRVGDIDNSEIFKAEIKAFLVRIGVEFEESENKEQP